MKTNETPIQAQKEYRARNARLFEVETDLRQRFRFDHVWLRLCHSMPDDTWSVDVNICKAWSSARPEMVFSEPLDGFPSDTLLTQLALLAP